MVILITDDNEDLRFLMTLMLEGEGNLIYTAANGKEALNILESIHLTFDVLVTDFNMPLMNGDELIQEIIKRGIQIKKIIIMSGIAENEGAFADVLGTYPNISFIHKLTHPDCLIEAILG